MKQMLVVRTDLNMRKGKMVAQGAHAVAFSLMFLRDGDAERITRWVNEFGMTKVCVGADSEQQLDDIERAAKEADISVHAITDAGHTEFHGVPTKTCLALGPDDSEKLDKITGALKLL